MQGKEEKTAFQKTAFQKWKEAGGSLGPRTLIDFLTSRRTLDSQQRNLRPFLAEGAAGNTFSITSFISLVLFVVVISIWIYSALPMVHTFFSFLGFSSSSSSSSQISFDLGAPPPPLAPAGDEDASGGGARAGSGCSVKVDDCSFSSVLKVSVDTGCNAICK